MVKALRARLEALPPAPAPNSSTSFAFPTSSGPSGIGEFWSYPQGRGFAELLIDLEEDKAAQAVVFGLLAEMERK